MKKKFLRKGTQLKLTNPKNAGRRAIHDIGIRHTKRMEINRPSALHLTIKLKKADIKIQNKAILKILRYAILRARLQGLKIIHYSLEHDHVHLHLYVECDDNEILGRSMKAFGVTLVKKMNKYFHKKGSAYKHRYHLRILKSASEVKNVINYILKNGMKHKRTNRVFDFYNSAIVIHDFRILGIKVISADIKESAEFKLLKLILDELTIYKRELKFVK